MILLSSKAGSKAVVVACPKCSRISRQILKDEYDSRPTLVLYSSCTCPICESIYSSLSNINHPEWSDTYSCYLNQGEQSYNNYAKHAYQISSQCQTTENNTFVNENTQTTPIVDTPIPKIIETSNFPTLQEVKPQITAAISAIKPMIEQPLSNTTAFDRKIEYWKKQLLDLSKRNKMINYRETKRTTLKFLEPEFAELFNRMAIKEEELTFQRPIDKNFNPKPYAMLSLLETLAYPIPVRVGDIKTDMSLGERRITLDNLLSKAKLARDEQGTNILYLSFGFIEWKEDNSANASQLKSPLLLMPVSLKRTSIRAPFTLTRCDDDIEINLTLAHLFKEGYGINLPAFKLKDEKSIELYMQEIESLVNKNGWKLTREVNLGLLSFLKIGMYYDIENNRDKMLQNPVIRAITGNTDAVNNIPDEFNNFAYDSIHPKDCYHVVNSDSSQQEAVMYSKAGISFVLQGPPGTGKSQTITNIIAEALADGKKILFVSEKAAALQVVYKRLSETGLSDFCLALHSHKANKREILDSIAANLKLESKHIKDSDILELSELFENRQCLNQYVNELHEKILPLEKSLYEVFGELASLHDASEIPFKLNNLKSLSSIDYHKMLYSVTNYAKALEKLGVRFSENPWHRTVVTVINQDFNNKLSQNIYSLDKQLLELHSTFSEILNSFKLNGYCTWSGLQDIVSLFNSIEVLPLFPKNWSDSSFRAKLINEAKLANEEKQKYFNALSIVTQYFNESIFNENLDFWLKSVRQNIDEIKLIKELSNLVDDTIIGMTQSYYNAANTAILKLEDTLAVILPDNIDKQEHTEIFGKIIDSLSVEHEWFNSISYTKEKPILLEAQARSITLKDKVQTILKEWEDTVFSIDVEAILSRFKTEYTSFFRIFKSSYRADIKTIKICSKKIGVKFKDNEIISLLLLLKEVHSEKKWFSDKTQSLNSTVHKVKDEILPYTKNLAALSKKLSDLVQIINVHSKQTIAEDKLLKIISLANYIINTRKNISDSYEYFEKLFEKRFNGLETSWDTIIMDLNSVSSFFADDKANTMPNEFIASICDNNDYRRKILEEKINIKNQINSIENSFNTFNDLFTKGAGLANLNLTELSKRVSTCLGNLVLLDNWLSCIETKAACDELGLLDFTAKIEQSDNTIKDVVAAFKRSFYTIWLQNFIGNKKNIEHFRRHIHDEKIARFASIDKKQLLIARERIRQKIIDSNIPAVTNYTKELNILKKEINKKSRFKPLRELFNNIPNLLLKLKPCMMMSPLSVAYFLEAKSYEFDMVIFDEASQIFPQDAIGAILRCKQAVIAGDSKQLPPTNFFTTNISNSGDDYDDEEYENEIYDSILEETAHVLPDRMLLWHYRSKHENLIAFSNQNIYGSDLITFPSSIETAPDLGVEFIFVEDGVYEGKGRNTLEARRCVELIKEHFDKYPNRSLGIIAFSESQQKTILQELYEFRERHPEYENFFLEDKEDEFFVKNLENVQGDERDTIIFSISYAKTKEQRDNNRSMALRFGPLGLKGGERRLNVAITRAKRNIKLVSSILPSDIDLSRTESEGIKTLRSYIEFAKNGSITLQTNNTSSEKDLFTDIVAEFITSQGYAIKKYFGHSAYKIDIAIINPKKENCFVAGIECDGFSYASTKTARDRDHLRKSVLETMEWNIYRIWSPEWIARPDIEQQKLLKFIENAINISAPIKETPNRTSIQAPTKPIGNDTNYG